MSRICFGCDKKTIKSRYDSVNDGSCQGAFQRKSEKFQVSEIHYHFDNPAMASLFK